MVAAAVIVLSGCEPEGPTPADAQVQKAPVSIAYVEWARATAISHVAAEILRTQGFEVELQNVANAAMWQSVASGDTDAILCAWLPATHQMFYGPEGEFSHKVVNMGPNYYGAQLGLVVPSYVDVDSMESLDANADKFDQEIVGIDPGAGMMQQTETMIDNDTYDMGDWTLLEGSGPTMTAALDDAILAEEPIVVTGWKPHWMFGRWDLKILDDPENVYGKQETINTIVREGLAEDNIAAFRFFEKFDWTQLDLGQALVWNEEGMQPTESAKQFVNENVETINELLPDDPYFSEIEGAF
jgi:glycine betaine/proline transport system substrate-binding protein